MTDINIVDMVLHIDNTLDTKVREAVENELRSINGVISVHMPDDRRHLVELAYNPRLLNLRLLRTVSESWQGMWKWLVSSCIRAITNCPSLLVRCSTDKYGIVISLICGFNPVYLCLISLHHSRCSSVIGKRIL